MTRAEAEGLLSEYRSLILRGWESGLGQQSAMAITQIEREIIAAMTRPATMPIPVARDDS